jgi:hypothetical protein
MRSDLFIHFTDISQGPTTTCQSLLYVLIIERWLTTVPLALWSNLGMLKHIVRQVWWFMPVILVTWEVDRGGLQIPDQPGQH